MNIYTLFPTPVGRSNIDRSLTAQELKYLRKLTTKTNVGNLISVDTYILNSPELAELKQELIKTVDEFFKETMKPHADVSPYITQSWLNITGGNQYHHRHSHPNSYISGVFYVQAHGDTDKITFHSDKNKSSIAVDCIEWDVFNSNTWWVPAVTGDVLLFPSTLEHEVEVPTSGKPRISIAFNTFLKGRLGSNNESTELLIN